MPILMRSKIWDEIQGIQDDLLDKILKIGYEQLATEPNFHQKVIFNDKAYFWMNDYVIKQSCSDANPHEIPDCPLHPEKANVWCGFWILRAGNVNGELFLWG